MRVFNNFSLSLSRHSLISDRDSQEAADPRTHSSHKMHLGGGRVLIEYPLWPVKEGNLAALFHWEQLGQFSDIGWQPLFLSPVELGKACASTWPSPSQCVLSV